MSKFISSSQKIIIINIMKFYSAIKKNKVMDFGEKYGNEDYHTK